MANNEQFEASVVAGIETPGAAQATQTFAKLLEVVSALEGNAKTAGLALVAAFEAGKKPAELATQIRILQREIKFLGTVTKGTTLFKDDEVSKVNSVNRAIAEAARAYDNMQKSQALASYSLGLDSKNAREAASSMKVLEQNLKAVDLALQKNSGNEALVQKKQLLTDNKALLEIVIRDLKQQRDQEKLNEQIAQQNFKNAQSRYAEVQRLTQRRKEEENSASAQTRASNAQLDYSPRGRAYAQQQANIKDARIDNSLLPGKQDMQIDRLLSQSTAQYLGQIYKDAGLAQTTIRATLNDSAKVRQLVGEIRDLEARMVGERAKGNISLQEEARILEQIRLKNRDIVNARRDQALNDPELRQARQDSQARNMLSRASGEGGAALLAVQASIMANYSILNTVTGSMRAAITTSVELEAAFRNVQAVTGVTGVEMAGLEGKIKDVSAASKFSSLEVANAALILGQAGLSAKQVGEALGPVVSLASAAGTSIAQAVDLVTSVIGVFDKSTRDIADIANKITQAANSSKVSVEKLALGFQYVGNAASQVGISFEETTAALAAMSQAGIKNGSTMGTGLRQFLTETEKPSKEFLATLGRLGLSLSDIDFKSNGLIGVTQKLRDAGFVASDAIKSFDVRGAAAFNALIANPAELERQYRLLQDTKAGIEANEVQMDSLKSQATRLTTSLGNLASSGFAPVGAVLQVVIGGFATLIHAVSEHNVLVGAAGVALAGLAASGAVSFFSNMAAGAVRFTGATGAAATAVLALQTATQVGSMGAFLTTLGLVSPTMTVAAASTGTLTTALNYLRASFLSLSVVTGVGIAVGAVVAGFYALEYITGRTAAEIEKLKAATSESRAVFEEKDAAVKSLTKKIDDLTYREENLTSNQKNLRTESLALTAQFGALGYTADQSNSSFDTMIDKLRKLKGAMSDVRKVALEKALADNQELLKKQTGQLQGNLTDANGGFFANGLSRDLDRFSRSDRLSKNERDILASASKQIKAGDTNNLGDVSSARLILQKLATGLEAQGGSGPVVSTLNSMEKSLKEMTTNLTEVNKTRSEIGGLDGMRVNNAGYAAFNTSGRFGASNGRALSFEESLPKVGNLALLARRNQGLANDIPAMDLFNAVKKEQEDRAQIYKARLKQIAETELSGQISDETANTARQLVKSREEKEKNELIEMARMTEDQAELDYNRRRRLLQAQARNAKMKNDKVEQARIAEALGALETTFKNRAETSAAKASSTAEAIKAITDQNIENINDRQLKGRNVNEGFLERRLKAQADQLDAAANESKSSIKTAESMEAVSKLMDEAIAKKFEAKAKRLELVSARQDAEKKAPGYDAVSGAINHKLELAAVTAEEDSKITTFADSFISLIEAAMKRLDETTKRIDETKRRISEQRMDAEDRVFDAQQELRETELAIATGRKVKGDTKNTTTYNPISARTETDPDGTKWKYEGIPGRTRFSPNGATIQNTGNGTASSITNSMGANEFNAANVSGAIRETLNQRRNRLIVESTRIELEENEKALAEYGDNTSGLIGDLGTQYREAKARSAELREKLKTETNEAVRAELTAMLSVSDNTVTSSFKDLRTARGERQKLQVDNFNIRKKAQENSSVLPEEVTLDSLLNKLDEVWEKYQDTVGQMDVMKVLGDGLTSTLGSTVGGLGNALSSIATGTKSVKDAFRDMSLSVIKNMVDILAQATAMQAVKGLLGLLGFGAASSGAGASAFGGGVSSTYADLFASGGVGVATGGLITRHGVERVRKMAGGGRVTGGVSGKDSVPAMLMPGEFVMKTKAVDAVGTDFLHALNSSANTVASQSQSVASSNGNKNGGGSVNVYVVTPDQKPSTLGPKDIVAVITDDMTRNGQLKKLVKSISMNEG